ncbi:hypothetical protein GCM10027416_24240 [Okibacterium endophyticum]
MPAQEVLLLIAQNAISGGVSDTEVKEFTAIPTCPPGVDAATIATPVG